MTTEATKPPEIIIKDANAVKELSISFDHGPGVYRLVGRNGAGKSETEAALAYAMGQGDGKPTLRRGAVKGTIQVGDIKLTIGKNVTGKRAEIIGVDCPTTIDALITGCGYKGYKEADAARMKAFVTLGGATPDESLFAELPDFATVGRGRTAETLVDLATVIRAAYNDAGLLAEKDAERETANAEAAKRAAADVDLALADADQEELQAAHATAVAEQQRLQAERNAAVRSQQAAEEARKTIAGMAAEKSVIEAEDDDRRAKAASLTAAERVAECRQALTNLEKTLAVAKQRSLGTAEILSISKSSARIRAACEAQIAAATSAGPTPDEMRSAQDTVQDARLTLERAAVARRAKDQLAAAQDFAEAAATHAAKAHYYRAAAWQTDAILSQQVAKLGQPLAWEADRLIYLRGEDKEFFGSLSWGERARIVCQMLVRVRGPGATVLLSQEAWEAIDVGHRDELEAAAVAAGVYILGPEAERERKNLGKPIRVEKYAVGDEG